MGQLGVGVWERSQGRPGTDRREAGEEGGAELPCTQVQVMDCMTLGAPLTWTLTVPVALGMALVDALISLCPGGHLDWESSFPSMCFSSLIYKIRDLNLTMVLKGCF